MIKEYLATGKIAGAEGIIKNSPELKATDTFTKIYGVGPRTAVSWYQMGIKNLEQLKHAVEHDEVKLNDDQKIGLKYYDVFSIATTR